MDPVDNDAAEGQDADPGADDASKPRRGRLLLGTTLMVLSFVPFGISVWLVAVHDDAHFAAAATIVLYGLSILMWYAGLFLVGGRAVDAWRERRRKRRSAATHD